MKIRFFLISLLIVTVQVLFADNYSLEFDGVDDYVDVGDIELFNFSTDIDFSIGAWIKSDETDNNNGIVTKAENGSYFTGYCFWISGDRDVGRLGFHYNDGSYTALNVFSNAYVNDGFWHHVFVTVIRGITGNISLYIDGELDISVPCNMSFNISNNASLSFGKDRNIGRFGGNIDEISIWETQLSQSEIQNLIYSQLTGNEPGLVGCWQFNEGIGTIAYDATINGNDGTIYGATWSTDVPDYIPLSLNPIAYYPFNGNADDETQNGNDGIVNGAVLIDDRFGNPNSAYYFSSAGGNTRIDVDINFDSNPAGFSISFWINRTGNGYINPPRVLEFYDGAGPGGDWQIKWPNSGNLSYMTTQLQNDIWYHVAITFDSFYFLSYLNGEFEGSYEATSPSWSLPFAGDAAFGRMNHSAWNAFNGKLDDISIYERVLNESEIQELYNFVPELTAQFTVDDTTTFVGYPIQFTDLSTIGEYPISTWSWDFQNDNEYDSFEQNPTFTYTDAGIYSVKLKISDGLNVDSLVMNNYITVVLVPPAPPTEVEINISVNDAIITWAEVDTTIFGTMITPDGYIILNNEDPYTDFIFLSFTPDTTYTHTYVGQYKDQMFYRVVAVINLSREEIKYLLSLNNSRDKVKWSDVKRNFNVIRK